MMLAVYAGSGVRGVDITAIELGCGVEDVELLGGLRMSRRARLYSRLSRGAGLHWGCLGGWAL